MTRILTCVLALLLLMAPASARTILTAPLTVYTSTTGSDSTGDGSSGNPWKTDAFAYNYIKENYDLSRGYVVTLRKQNGTFTNGTQLYGALIGQNFPWQFTITGDCTDRRAVKVQASDYLGPAYGFYYGVKARLQCMWVDGSHLWSAYPNSTDLIQVAGNGSDVEFGNSSMFGSGPDMVYGCNFAGGNVFTVTDFVAANFNNDFDIDVNECQKNVTGNIVAGQNTMTGISNMTGLSVGMGILAANVPTTARIGSINGNSVTYVCASLVMNCVNAATTSGVSASFVGGGQAFIDWGKGARVNFNTNGDPDFSIVVKLIGYPHYSAGFVYVNQMSMAYMQAVTFENPHYAFGFPFDVQNKSILDTGKQGLGYFPGLNGIGCGNCAKLTTATTTAGSPNITVSSASGFFPGAPISSYVTPTATYTSGSKTVSVSSTANITAGDRVMHSIDGIRAGATVESVGAGTITVGGCSGLGPRCPSGSPVYASRTNYPIIVTGHCIPNGTVVISVSGTTLGLSQAATCSDTFQVRTEGRTGPGWFDSSYN